MEKLLKDIYEQHSRFTKGKVSRRRIKKVESGGELLSGIEFNPTLKKAASPIFHPTQLSEKNYPLQKKKSLPNPKAPLFVPSKQYSS